MSRSDLSYIYILTNERNNMLYTGVTTDLYKRVTDHKAWNVPGFTKKYRVHKLVYYEKFGTITEAIAREKQIKGGSRSKKIGLVNKLNPEWKDLFFDLQGI